MNFKRAYNHFGILSPKSKDHPIAAEPCQHKIFKCIQCGKSIDVDSLRQRCDNLGQAVEKALKNAFWREAFENGRPNED